MLSIKKFKFKKKVIFVTLRGQAISCCINYTFIGTKICTKTWF